MSLTPESNQVQETSSVTLNVLKKLEFIQKLTPYITALGLLYSAVKLYSYYTLFAINIYNFIEISELVKIILKDSLVLVLIVYALIPLYVQVLRHHLSKISGRWIYGILVLLSIVSIITTLMYPVYEIFYQHYLIYLNAIVPVIIVLTETKRPEVIILIILFCIVIIGVAYSNNLARMVKDESYTLGNSIQLKETKTIIMSTTKFIYIGKTNNYVFFYDKVKGETVIYKMDDVKSLTIRKDI